MKYKSIYEQNETFISILKQNKDLMTILDYISYFFLCNVFYGFLRFFKRYLPEFFTK